MKIRIRGNSVRLRLEREEVGALERGESIAQQLTLSPKVDFVYRCETGETSNMALTPLDMGLLVTLPKHWLEGWSRDDRVGFEGEIETAPGTVVRVTVEKDFKCLTERPNEDDSGAYPHPEKAHCANDTSE